MNEDLAASPKPLYTRAIRATLVGLAANFFLGAVKLTGGMIGGSFALVSDAINSLGDSLSSVVTLAALWYAQLPADEEHPYGHTRVEAVAGAYIALVIIGTGIYLGVEAMQLLTATRPIPPVWSLWIAGGNAVLKEWLYWYNRRVAIQTGSSAMLASAWDHRSDAMCSLAVVVGLAAVRWAGPGYAWADGGAALCVVGAIMWSGARLLKQSTGDLLDPQADPDLVAQVRGLATSVPGVSAVEKLWVRKTGIEYLVDIHIQVDPLMTVDEGHRISHDVKNRLINGFALVKDVLVHLEPYHHETAATSINTRSVR